MLSLTWPHILSRFIGGKNLKIIFPNSVSFGVFSHSKGLGATSLLWRFLGQIPSASKKVLWVLWKVPPTVLYICLPVFSGYVEGSPNSSVHLSPNFLFEKGSVEGSPNFFRNGVSFGVFSHSKGVLCSKWLSPPKRFFGVFPKQFFTFVSQSPAFFLGKWLLLQKRFSGGLRQLFFTFVSQVALQ